MPKLVVAGILWMCLLGWLTLAIPARAEVSISATSPIAVEPTPKPIEGGGKKPAVASSGSGWLAVWANGYSAGIVGRVIGSDGVPSTPPFDIWPGELDGSYFDVWFLDVVFDGTSFVVVWMENWANVGYSGAALHAQRVSVDGTLIGQRQVLASGNRLGLVGVAPGGGGVLVAECTMPSSTVECALYLSTGGELELTDAMEFPGLELEEVALGFSQGAWLLALDGTYIRINGDGTFVEDTTTRLYQNGSNNGGSASVVGTPNGFALAWEVDGSVYLADVPFSGSAVIRDTPLLSGAINSNAYHHPRLRQSNSGYLLVSRRSCFGGCNQPETVGFLELDQNLDPVGDAVPTAFAPRQGFEEAPNLAFDNNLALVVYASEQGVITGQRMTASPVSTLGAGISLPLRAPWQSNIRAVRLGQGWLAVWEEGEGLKGAVLGAEGEPQQEPFDVHGEFQEFQDISGGETGALIALQAGFKTIVLHVDLSGNIDRTTELERSTGLRLASSSSGWLALYDSYTWNGYTLTAQRVALDGTPLEATALTEWAAGGHGMAVVTTADGYKVFWTEQDAIWSRRLLFDGTWLCEKPTLVAAPEGGAWRLSGVVADAASWFTFFDPSSGYGQLLALPSGNLSHPTYEVTQLSRVNSAAVGLTVWSDPPYEPLYHLEAAEPDQPLTSLLERRAWQASLSQAEGNVMLLASTHMVRLYGEPVRRVSTSVVTVSGGFADVVPADIPYEECPVIVGGGDGGAAGAGGALGNGGGSATEGGASDGGASDGGASVGGVPGEPTAGGPSSGGAGVGHGGESEQAAGRDSAGGLPSTADGGAGGLGLVGEGGNGTNSAGQPMGESSGNPNRESRGCGCRAAEGDSTPSSVAIVAALLALSGMRRRHRRAPARLTRA